YRDVQRVLDESERVAAEIGPDSAFAASIQMSKAMLGYWSDQNAPRALVALERINEPRQLREHGDLAQARIILCLVSGDSTRAQELLRTEGTHLSADGRAVVEAVRAMVRGDCKAGARLAAQRASFGANRGAREVLRYISARCLTDAGHPDQAIP